VVDDMPTDGGSQRCTAGPDNISEPGAEQALRTCLRVFEALGDSAGTDACRRALALPQFAAQPMSPGGLTPRERQVAALIAAGSTNRQIAQALQISSGTAGRHVANIYLKLGFHTRAQLASWYASTAGGPG
jgi:DNA-binding CsgD family transcriptional regulator